jgi:uncharacterized membrane protein YedE/YeeE
MTLAQLFPNGIAHYLQGGLILGAGVSLLYVLTGRVGGMSTVFTSTLSYVSGAPYFLQPRFVDNRDWRLAYAAGVILGGAAYVAYTGGPAFHTSVPVLALALGGFLVGFGARLANGCTSGHGICGLASLQWSSLLAVATFLATAIITANMVAALGGRP